MKQRTMFFAFSGRGGLFAEGPLPLGTHRAHLSGGVLNGIQGHERVCFQLLLDVGEDGGEHCRVGEVQDAGGGDEGAGEGAGGGGLRNPCRQAGERGLGDLRTSANS